MNFICKQIQQGVPIALIMMAFAACSTTDQTQGDISRALLQSEAEPQIAEPVDDDYRIKIGDEVEVLVWEEAEFNTSTTVSRTGTIAMPLLGEIQVAGLTRDELERRLKRRLAEYIRGDVNLTISIQNTQDLMVSVFGMVSRPDNYPIVNETSIFNILSTAGGPTDDANIRKVKIYRSGGVNNFDVVDLSDYLENGMMHDSATKVYPGDIVYVPRQNNAIREMSGFLGDVALLFGLFRVFR